MDDFRGNPILGNRYMLYATDKKLHRQETPNSVGKGLIRAQLCG